MFRVWQLYKNKVKFVFLESEIYPKMLFLMIIHKIINLMFAN